MTIIDNNFLKTIQTEHFKKYFESSNIRIYYNPENFKRLYYKLKINKSEIEKLKNDTFYKRYYQFDLIIYMYAMYSPNKYGSMPMPMAKPN